MKMLLRKGYLRRVEQALSRAPVCALLGPRQCGKTTLARQVAARKRSAHVFDLETASGRARLAHPELALSPLQGLVILDEIQRRPELFETLRPLADRPRSRARFLILGSASPRIVREASESLAGRLAFVDMSGFDLGEIDAKRRWRSLWLRGGFPRSYLSSSDARSLSWRKDFVRTFLERDLPQLGIRVPPETLGRFWNMVAHAHGQIWNGADLSRSLGVSENTVRGYLDLLSGSFVVRILPPWFENIAKRQYRSPKVYIRDSGLLHALLSIETFDELSAHPKFGASWEGFALEQVMSLAGPRDAYFWGTHGGGELDLLLLRRGRRFGIEFKLADAPRMTKSLHVALQDLKPERIWVVYPGTERYALHAKVEALPLLDMPRQLAGLG
jgi:predicted AAA+ superfamily ATPase